jgi:hypothetical protein
MSNCIDFNSPPVRLTGMQIDVPALKALVEKVKDLEKAPAEWGDENIAWWFLSHAEFDGNKSVLIDFGNGRSTHTFRDFGATMLLIGRLARIQFDVKLGVRDTHAPTAWSRGTWRVVPNGGDWL